MVGGWMAWQSLCWYASYAYVLIRSSAYNGYAS